MADALPDPLTPPEVNLRGYDFMPFYGNWLRESDFNAKCTDSEYRAAVNLWWSSWWQIPAASLPNDDITLCKLADLKSMRTWRRVKPVVLASFVLCSDNRWHHTFLSVVAREAFSKKKSAKLKGVIGAQKRWKNNRAPDAPANATGNAPASPKKIAQALPQPSKKNSWSNGKGSKEVLIDTDVTRTRAVDKSTAAPVNGSRSPAAVLAERAGVKLRTDTPPPAPDPSEPTDDELLAQMRKPKTVAAATLALNGSPPADWHETTEGIDRAGEVLGMKRLPFEEDPDFARRIEARIALG